MTIWFWVVNDFDQTAVLDDEEEAVRMAETHPNWIVFSTEMRNRDR